MPGAAERPEPAAEPGGLSLAAADEPAYVLTFSDGRRRKAHTFGDCDEFEMTYVNLLQTVGIDGEVFLPASITRRDHVRTRLAVGPDDHPVWLEVDNTRDGVAVSGEPPEAYIPRRHLYNIDWINAHARAELDIPMGRPARERLDARIQGVLGLAEFTGG